jgi:heptaprenyl diphosphate synthase
MKQYRQSVAFYAAVSAFLGVFESFIPIPVPFLRLGLSNIPVITGLSLFRFRDLLFIVLFKVVIAHLFRGSLFSYPFLVGLSGNLLFIIAVWPLYRVSRRYASFISYSLLGALFHNIGQLAMATLFIPYQAVLWIGLLLVSLGVVTGFINGVLANRVYNGIIVRLVEYRRIVPFSERLRSIE